MAVVRSSLRDIAVPTDLTVTDWLLRQVEGLTDRPALVNSESGETYSYNDLRRSIHSVQWSFGRHGLKRGDTLCMFARNSPQFALLLMSAFKAEIRVTGVNPAFTPAELARQVRDSGAKHLFTEPEYLDKVALSGVEFQTIIVLGEAEGCVSFSELESSSPPRRPQQDEVFDGQKTIAMLPYSSGTTGLPKGVMLSHYNLITNVMQITHPDCCLIRQKGETIVGITPFFHVSGIIVTLLNILSRQGTLIIMPTFDYVTFLTLVARYRATVMTLVPPILQRMAKDPNLGNYDLSSVQTIGVGSAPIAPQLVQELRRKMGLHDISQGWGMTETTCVGTIHYPGIKIKEDSVGKLVPNTEVKIVDVATGQLLGTGSRGELWIRGPQVMVGYWRRPQQTRDTLSTDGWLRTGDIAYLDDEGYIYIVDRIKELIKVKAFQVAPAELEAELLTHPAVMDAAVVGVEDHQAGEVPRAYVVLRPTVDKPPKPKDIQDFIETRVAPYKTLRGGVVFLKEIPKSPSGKILRRRLKSQSSKRSSKL